jgi:predicted nucleotidyltransferase
MEANPFLRLRVKAYLENILDAPVDVIREHNNMNNYLKQQIHKDAVYIFQ